MQEDIEEELSESEIRVYVDRLIRRHRIRYDRRIRSMLYEFFLRSNEKFHWSREEFLHKYHNFEKNTRTITFKRMPNQMKKGRVLVKKRCIQMDKSEIVRLRNGEEESYHNFIDRFFHECSHQTDRDSKTGIDGLNEIRKGKKIKKDHSARAMNEYGNIVAACLISSEKPMYSGELPIIPRVKGYEDLVIPGSIMCAALDIPERKIAELKDKGRIAFEQYLKQENPNLKMDVVIKCFQDNFTKIFYAGQTKNENSRVIGYQNIINMALKLISIKIYDELRTGRKDEKEFAERIWFDLYKIDRLIEYTKEIYQISGKHFKDQENLKERVKGTLYFYRKLIEYKEQIPNVDMERMQRQIEDKIVPNVLLRSIIGKENYEKPIEYDLEGIVKKYYHEPNEPLNNNKKLIDEMKEEFNRLTMIDKAKEMLKKISRKDKLISSNLNVIDDTTNRESNNFRQKLHKKVFNGEEMPRNNKTSHEKYTSSKIRRGKDVEENGKVF